MAWSNLRSMLEVAIAGEDAMYEDRIISAATEDTNQAYLA
jgi:hypothetical protein